MDTETITDWQTLASIAEKYKTERWIFRGVGDSDYELIPRVGRPDTSKDINAGTNLGYSADFEQRCMDLFKREAGPHLHIQPESNLDWLSIAQHHGVPTRLLDWTDGPLVAAYFALEPGGFIGREQRDAAVYGLPCPKIVAADEEITEEVVAYFPRHVTPRITAQRGLFTYHRSPDQVYKPAELVKWVLPGRICFTLKVILNKCGINEASMFPDLDGIAKHVRWLLKWRMP
jgi:hypothetical protein